MNVETLDMEGRLFCTIFLYSLDLLWEEIPGYVGLTYNFQKLEKTGCGGIYL